MSANTVQQATNRLRAKQSTFAVRKESITAAVALLVWVATIIAENVDRIPTEAGVGGQIVGVVASVVALAVARGTVPALTPGQQDALMQEAHAIEAAEAREEAEATPAQLPVYDTPTEG